MASSLPHAPSRLAGAQTPVGTSPVFDRASAKFKKSLTKHQTQVFANCTLDDVKNEIKSIQSQHGSQRRSKSMERLSRFIEGMDQLGKVIEVFLNLHNTVALIWGPLKFLLLTAKTAIDSFDSLLDVFAQIGEILPDLTRYEHIYKEYPAVHTHLEAYYCDILQFYSNALDVFARPCWKVMFHSAWKTFKTKFDPILKSLERHRIMLSEEKLTAVMEETQRQGRSIQYKLDQLNRELQDRDNKDAERDLIAHQDRIDQQRRVVESKIDCPDYYQDYEIASQKRFKNTSGCWILSHPVVSDWLEQRSNANGKIYLSGIPGAGKTVLTSSVISHLKERQSSVKDSADRFSISYFYFKHDQPEKRSLVSMLLAVLNQLVAQDESLLDHVYQVCCSTEPQQFRSLDEISRHVFTALQSQSRCFIIIDGLDECSEINRVLKWFESVLAEQGGTEKASNFNIRLFISGQRDGIIENQMTHYSMINLETSAEHDEDIKAFAATMSRKIRDKFSLDLPIEQEITSRVTTQAGGMFLYAQLVLGNLLCQTSKYDLKQEMKAETFPEGLDQAYDRIIIRVLRNPNKAERAAARHILGVIICSCRPLHWREIQSKFCIDPSKGEADIDRELVMSCKQICSSLVDVSHLESSLSMPGEEIIDLVHSSAKVYLVQTKEFDIATENAKMALFCAEYMISRPLIPGLSKSEVQGHAKKGYYGFHDYAVAFWWEHVQQVLTTPESDMDLALRVLQTAHGYMINTGELDQPEDLDDSSGDIQSLKSSLEGISRALRDWKVIKNYEMRVVAIRSAIQELIDKPQEPKQATLALYGPWRYKCRKPWCPFFSHGFEKAEQHQIHINQHELPFTCVNPGCFATEVGFEKEADLKSHTRRWHPDEETSLFPAARRHPKGRDDTMEAAKKGDLNTIKYLIENGHISPDYQKGMKGNSLVEVAAQNGHLHVLQYLKRMGADFNAKTPHAPNLLLNAVERCDLEIVTFLCGLNSFTPNSINIGLRECVDMVPFPQQLMAQLLYKATPECLRGILSYAIETRSTAVVRYLADTIDASYLVGTLNLAIVHSNLACLDALLSSGKVDPNTSHSKGILPLHVAAGYNSLPIFQRIYSVTNTTNIEHELGNTPLHLASKCNKVAIVEFLIKEGADVNAEDIYSETPLQLAISLGHKEVQKLLSDQDARLDLAERSIGSTDDASQELIMDNSHRPLFDSNP